MEVNEDRLHETRREVKSIIQLQARAVQGSLRLVANL